MLLGNELAGKLLLHSCVTTFAIFLLPFSKNRSIVSVISNINIVLLNEQLTIHVGNNNMVPSGKLLHLSLQGEEPWRLLAWEIIGMELGYFCAPQLLGNMALTHYCGIIWALWECWTGTTGSWEGNWRAGHLLCCGQVKMESRASTATAGREGVGEGKNCSFSLGLKFQLGFSNHRDLLPFQLVGWNPVGCPLVTHFWVMPQRL